MEKYAISIGGAAKSVRNGFRSAFRQAKNMVPTFFSLRPAKRQFDSKYKTADGRTHVVWKDKPRINLLDLLFPGYHQFIGPWARDGFKNMIVNYGRYMRNHPYLGTFKTVKNVLFPTSVPITLTALGMLGKATAPLDEDTEYTARDKGVDTGLLARLGLGSLSAKMYRNSPQWVRDWFFPDYVKSTGEGYIKAYEQNPELVSKLEDYANAGIREGKTATKNFLLDYLNPIHNMTLGENTMASFGFLRNLPNRVKNVSAYVTGATNGKPLMATAEDYKDDIKGLAGRSVAQYAGVANGILDDYSSGKKDQYDALEDNLIFGARNNIFKTQDQQENDVTSIRENVRALSDGNATPLAKMRASKSLLDVLSPPDNVKQFAYQYATPENTDKAKDKLLSKIPNQVLTSFPKQIQGKIPQHIPDRLPGSEFIRLPFNLNLKGGLPNMYREYDGTR